MRCRLAATQAAVGHLVACGGVINIGSGVSCITPPNSAVYTRTLGAVEEITGVQARKLRPRRIRDNMINVFPASDDSGWIAGEQLLAIGGIR